eukprot:gene10481-7286_t
MLQRCELLQPFTFSFANNNNKTLKDGQAQKQHKLKTVVPTSESTDINDPSAMRVEKKKSA